MCNHMDSYDKILADLRTLDMEIADEDKDDTSMHNHLDAYDKILADLRNLDAEITEEDKTLYLLNSLPDLTICLLLFCMVRRSLLMRK